METFLKIVAQANTSEILSISSDEIIRNLNVCQTIQQLCLEKSSSELESIRILHVNNHNWLTIPILQTACSYYITLLLNNKSFVKMPLETKQAFYSFCHEHGYDKNLSSFISQHLYYQSKIAELQKDVDSLKKSYSSCLSSSSLPSFNELRNEFILFSLSEESLSLQCQAYQLHKKLCDYSTSNISQLQQTMIELNTQMRQHNDILNLIITSFLLTYIPVINMDHFPFEKPLSISNDDNSLRYLLYKLLESYLSNLQWNKEECCFIPSDSFITNIFSIHPFLLYLCSVCNFSFLQMTISWIVERTLYQFELQHSLNDRNLMILWGCFLRFAQTPVQRDYLKNLLQSVYNKASPSTKEAIGLYFNCIL